MDNEIKCYLIAVISLTFTTGLIIGYTLQKESSLEQTETILFESANSKSHLLSINGTEIYFIIPFNPYDFPNLNLSEHLNLSECSVPFK